MAYSTRTDIETLFGAANVARWSSTDPHNPATVNDARITAAIAYADALIDSRLRRRFTVPLTGNSALTTNWSAVLAAQWLYAHRGAPQGELDVDPDASRINGMVRAVTKEIDAVRSGMQRPGFAESGTHTTAPFVVGA